MTMKCTAKRLITMLLCAMLLAGLMPVLALAEEPGVENGETIVETPDAQPENGGDEAGETETGSEAAEDAEEPEEETADESEDKASDEPAPAALSLDGEGEEEGEGETDYAAKIGSAGYETLAAAIAAAQSGDTVTLLKDVELTETITIDKGITLDLGGNTVNGICAYTFIVTGCSITIQNGTIRGSHNSKNGGAAITVADATVTLTDVFVRVNGGYTYWTGLYGVLLEDGGTLVCNNAEIRAHTYCIYAKVTSRDVSITINGGDYWAVRHKSTLSSGTIAEVEVASAEADVTINGGTFRGGQPVHVYYKDVDVQVNINGGYFTSTLDELLSIGDTEYPLDNGDFSGEAELGLFGGYYDRDVSEYVAEGYECVETGDEDYPYYVRKAAAAPTGKLENFYFGEDSDNPGRYGIFGETTGMSNLLEDTYIILCDNDGTKMATARLKSEYINTQAQDVAFVTFGDESSVWEVVWEDGMPSADALEPFMVEFFSGETRLDGVMVFAGSKDTGETWEWEELPGVTDDNPGGDTGDTGDTGAAGDTGDTGDTGGTGGADENNTSATKKTPTVPKTGDESHLWLWTALALTGCAAGAALVIARKKEN